VLPQKLKLKTFFIEAKKSQFLSFFILIFLEVFCHQASSHFGNQHKNLDFFIPHMTYLKENNFYLAEEHFFKFLAQKPIFAKSSSNYKKILCPNCSLSLFLIQK
jgi:hypothetical protein